MEYSNKEYTDKTQLLEKRKHRNYKIFRKEH